MTDLAGLIADIDGSLARGGAAAGSATLRHVTDLFVTSHSRLTDEQVAVFDALLIRLLAVADAEARAALAQRFCDLAAAPRLLILALARDEIAVARPVLTRSSKLEDQDLVEVAAGKGEAHMLAIGVRERLSALVVDILVELGPAPVLRVLAANRGARFSTLAMATMVSRSRGDRNLQDLLGRRADLEPRHLQALVAWAEETERQALVIGRARVLRRRPSRRFRLDPRHVAALDDLQRRQAVKPLGEEDIVTLAEAGQRDIVVCAVARMSDLPIPLVDEVFRAPESDVLMVIARAQGWGWATLRALLVLRDPSLRLRHQFRRAQQVFDSLVFDVAESVLGALAVRYEEPVEAQPARVNVR